MALKEYEEVYPTEDELAVNSSQNLCSICNKKFENKGALRMHSVKTHRQLNVPTDVSLQSRTRRISQITTKRFHCPNNKCNKTCENLRNLTQHFQKVHCEKVHECLNCGNKFALERDLRYHAKQRCFKTNSQLATIERKTTKRQKRKATQSTQTECITVKLVLAQPAKTLSGQTQTEDQILDYQINSNYSTSDFAGQYDHANFNEFAQNVSTFDQATMYDNFASTSSYVNETPEMVDVAIDSQNYFIDPTSYLTQTTQTYINPECSQWREYDYRSTQINSSTQTTQPPLESWFGRDQMEGISRDMGSMTDQMHFR